MLRLLLLSALTWAAPRARAAEVLDISGVSGLPAWAAGVLADYRLYDKGGIGVYYRRIRPGTMPFIRYRAQTVNLPLHAQSFRVGGARSGFYNQPDQKRRSLRRGDFFYHREGQVRGGWVAESTGTYDSLIVSFPAIPPTSVSSGAAAAALPERDSTRTGRYFPAAENFARVDARSGPAKRAILLDDRLRVVLLRLDAAGEAVNATSSAAVLFPLRGAARVSGTETRLDRDSACVLAPGEAIRLEPESGESFYALLIAHPT